jgi:ATP/maltotriose-dependent transcriptional regulator MalT
VDPGKRAEALGAQAEIALAANDVAAARMAANELLEIAERLDAEFLKGLSSCVHGAVLLAEQQLQGAVVELRKALACFRHLEVPYEAARAQVLLARAYQQQGAHEAAGPELAAARDMFQRLGAATDLARLDMPAKLETPMLAGPLSLREIEVLKLVASGITNRQIAKTLKISEKTVARHLSNIFNKLDISSRAAATAYAYQHNLL